MVLIIVLLRVTKVRHAFFLSGESSVCMHFIHIWGAITFTYSLPKSYVALIPIMWDAYIQDGC